MATEERLSLPKESPEDTAAIHVESTSVEEEEPGQSISPSEDPEKKPEPNSEGTLSTFCLQIRSMARMYCSGSGDLGPDIG